MYVIRWNAKAKRGQVNKVIELNKAMQINSKVPVRFLVNLFGDNDIVSTEAEFENLDDVATFMKWLESGAIYDGIERSDWFESTAGLTVEMWKTVD